MLVCLKFFFLFNISLIPISHPLAGYPVSAIIGAPLSPGLCKCSWAHSVPQHCSRQSTLVPSETITVSAWMETAVSGALLPLCLCGVPGWPVCQCLKEMHSPLQGSLTALLREAYAYPHTSSYTSPSRRASQTSQSLGLLTLICSFITICHNVFS